MTKEEILKGLETCRIEGKEDPEAAHVHAVELLVRYIGDAEIISAFNRIESLWYA